MFQIKQTPNWGILVNVWSGLHFYNRSFLHFTLKAVDVLVYFFTKKCSFCLIFVIFASRNAKIFKNWENGDSDQRFERATSKRSFKYANMPVQVPTPPSSNFVT